MTAPSQDRAVESSRSHRSLARKLTWHRAPYGTRAFSSSEAKALLFLDEYLIRAREERLLGSYTRHVRVFLGHSWATDIEQVFLTFGKQFDLVSPSLQDREAYEHYYRRLEELCIRLLRSHGEADQWPVSNRDFWRLEPPSQAPQLREPPNDFAQDRNLFWEEVPTNELIRRHKAVPVKDVEELRLDLWESEQELEAFIKDIEAARRSDTI
jgi:hypothetical protein